VLETDDRPGDPAAPVERFVVDQTWGCHGSIISRTLADVTFGRGQTILVEREGRQRQSIQQRRLIR